MTSAILSCCLYFCQLLLEFLKSIILFLNNNNVTINNYYNNYYGIAALIAHNYGYGRAPSAGHHPETKILYGQENTRSTAIH